MTAVDFPNSPQVNDTFTVGERTWKWTGTTWDAVVDPVGVASGGTQGQVLTKVGNTNYVTTWANTVSSVVGGTGLTGGTITTTGTLAVDSAVIPFLSATQTFTGTQTMVAGSANSDSNYQRGWRNCQYSSSYVFCQCCSCWNRPKW